MRRRDTWYTVKLDGVPVVHVVRYGDAADEARRLREKNPNAIVKIEKDQQL